MVKNKNNSAIFLLLLLGLLAIGYFALQGQPPNQTTNAGATQPQTVTGTGDTAQSYQAYLVAPNSYCINYVYNQNYVEGYSMQTEYCTDGTSQLTTTNVIGSVITDYCIQGQAAVCVSDGTNIFCNNNPDSCNQYSPYASFESQNLDLRYFFRGQDRQIAGFNARCYYMTVNSDRAELCFHPQYNLMLYYSMPQFGSLQVSNIMVPAPASKFVLPAQIQ